MENIKDQSGIKCYDWSENSYHIAGKLGYTLANGLIKLCWIKKSTISRELKITQKGKVNLYKNFDIEL
ncbi:hypothetical protein LGK95_13565 [Clostridium algoriphilum]|uniref:hypothetical protein n=1 Tax=Clostridium algoriphilum TaxID=198347 RepID=UPI001CF305A4|nr:hypothetical protein [Clostridium algoriphilum]MCB2294537.1 hypothetical protein [Clostridium algoriphilum]